MNPMLIMVKTAPISINNSVVPKSLTPVFSETIINDLLKKTLAITTNTKSKIRLLIMAVKYEAK